MSADTERTWADAVNAWLDSVTFDVVRYTVPNGNSIARTVNADVPRWRAVPTVDGVDVTDTLDTVFGLPGNWLGGHTTRRAAVERAAAELNDLRTWADRVNAWEWEVGRMDDVAAVIGLPARPEGVDA